MANFQYDAWFAILAPAATPTAIVDKVSHDVADALAEPHVKARFAPQGVEIAASAPDRLDAVLRSDAERYGKLLKPMGN